MADRINDIYNSTCMISIFGLPVVVMIAAAQKVSASGYEK